MSTHADTLRYPVTQGLVFREPAELSAFKVAALLQHHPLFNLMNIATLIESGFD